MTYPSGETVKYQYDSMLRLKSLEYNNDFILDYKYDEKGNLEKKISSTGIETEYQYNACGFLKSIINQKNSKILDRLDYEYDQYGRKVALTKYRSDYTEENGKYSFKYDCLGRLAEVQKDGQTLTSYEYDPFGNRTLMMQNNYIVKYEYDQLNQMVSRRVGDDREKYSYDKRGNMISVRDNSDNLQKQFEYGAINRLEKVVNDSGMSANYIYNGLGYRVQKKVRSSSVNDTINYLIDMTKQHDNLLQKKDSCDCQNFVWDKRLNVIGQTSGENYYCTSDDLGSPLRLFDRDGETSEVYDFNEFGEERILKDSQINPFTFIGYQRDSISNTYFAQAREYLPMAGRFAARDFVPGSQEDIISNNEYLYCKDDPNDYIDQNGMFAVLAAIAIGAGVGALTNAAVNAATQGIKIAQGKQEGFKKGELLGAVAEGAIVGGVSAIQVLDRLQVLLRKLLLEVLEQQRTVL